MFGVNSIGRRTVLAIWLLSWTVLVDSSSSLNDDRDFPRASGQAKPVCLPSDHGADDRPTSAPDLENRRDHATRRRRETPQQEKKAASPSENGPRTRVPLCCPLASRLASNGCVPINGTADRFRFPPLYDSTSFALINETTPPPDTRRFDPFVRDPCDDRERYKISVEDGDAFMLLDNGSIYEQDMDKMLADTEYCLAIVDSDDALDVVLCFDSTDEPVVVDGPATIAFPVGLIVSVPFLFATFLVYAIVPELDNMHGRTLRGYVGPLLVAYAILAVVQISPQERISNPVCIAFAFIIHFSFLASFFWLNVMCFDIWWTFGGFRSLQGSVKQRERKKFLIYSIYAWGCASLFTGVCVLMDFLPNIPDHFIKPEFGEQSCWFNTDKAKAIYFYGPMGITVLCNVCLFVSTALKIVQHKKDTAHHLKGVDSRRHDDNKQWFNLYLKLFIVMGINWSMEIISWLCNESPAYIWYLTDLTNTLQGVIIFLIFVWKEKIRRLLLKRFGCHGRNFLSRNSTRSAYHSSASRTCTTTAAQLQEKVNPYTSEHSSSRSRSMFVENSAA